MLGDAVAPFAGFDAGLLHRIHLQKFLQLFGVAPMAAEVVVFQLAAGQVANERIPPAGKLSSKASRRVTKELDGLPSRLGKAKAPAGGQHSRRRQARQHSHTGGDRDLDGRRARARDRVGHGGAGPRAHPSGG